MHSEPFWLVLHLTLFPFRNIEDLTSQVNNLEIKVNDSEMENEELRERLGMDPKESLNIEDVRHKKKVKAEQAVALNRALNKEVIYFLHFEENLTLRICIY